MGLTKKQRREQKKSHAAQSRHYKKRRNMPLRTPAQQPARPARPQQTRVLIKTAWVDKAGEPQEMFQLRDLAAGTDAEQFRLELLALLSTQDKAHGIVEFFDPDNVPAGTIPAHVRIMPG
jgi:hypothetical protein